MWINRATSVPEWHFDSLTDMRAFITPVGEKVWSIYAGHWSTASSVNDALRQALSSSKYSTRIEALTGRMVGLVSASIRDVEYGLDVTGLDFDMGLLMSGAPECWITRQPSREPKIVRMLLHMNSSSMVSTQSIEARGVAIAALVRILELSGVATEITIYGESDKRDPVTYDGGMRYFLRLKDSGEYFDLEKFSWAICSPAMSRCLGFGVVFENVKKNHSIGWTAERYNATGYDIHFDRMFGPDPEFASEGSTREWIVKKCREFGVDIRDEA